MWKSKTLTAGTTKGFPMASLFVPEVTVPDVAAPRVAVRYSSVRWVALFARVQRRRVHPGKAQAPMLITLLILNLIALLFRHKRSTPMLFCLLCISAGIALDAGDNSRANAADRNSDPTSVRLDSPQDEQPLAKSHESPSLFSGELKLREGTIIPPGSIVAGVPGKVIRERDSSIENRVNALVYHRNAQAYRRGHHRAWEGPEFKAWVAERTAELESED